MLTQPCSQVLPLHVLNNTQTKVVYRYEINPQGVKPGNVSKPIIDSYSLFMYAPPIPEVLSK